MFGKLILICTLLCGMTLSSLSTQAGVCSTRANLLKGLSDRYKESRQAIGLISRTKMLEVYASKKGSWTILVTTAGGVSCIVAAGQAFEQIPKTIAPITRPDA